MTITKVSRGLLNTGISDSSDATAITIDSSENSTFAGTVKVNGAGNTLELNASSGVTYQKFSENGTGRFFLATLNGADGLAFVDADGSAERMRIDASGNLLVGKTSNTQASAGFQIDGSNLHNVTSTNSGTGSSTYMVHDGSGLNFYVNFTGEVNYKVALTNLSDQRLKENIVNLDKGLNDILKIKPRRFDWIEGEGEKNQMGFIAQEVEEAGLEELVRPFKGGSLDDAKGVNQTGLIAILVKAIQEQQTQIEALQSEINTLKGGD